MSDTFTPINSVQILNEGTAIKQGDTNTVFIVKLLDVNGQPKDLTGATVQVYFSKLPENALLFEKTATVGTTMTDGTISFSFNESDVTGIGQIRLQFNVTYGNGTIEKFPANDYAYIMVNPSLDDLEIVKISSVTVDQLRGSLTTAFSTSIANVQTSLQTNINNKVDKISGKSLSTNDFTNDYKIKLDSISSAMDIDGGVWS